MATVEPRQVRETDASASEGNNPVSSKMTGINKEHADASGHQTALPPKI